MLLTPVLDVLIGLSLFYLLIALICTTVNEMFASGLNTRAKFLDKGIDRLLSNDPDLKAKLYNHPLIKSLKPGDGHDPSHLPSYIPAEKFATALLDIISGAGKKLTDVDAIRNSTIGHQDVRDALNALADISPDAEALQKNVEEWFNSGMDRVTGWFKKNRQKWCLVLAAIITLFLHADTLSVVHVLWTNPATRAAVVDLAKKRSEEPPPPSVEYPDPDNPKESQPVVKEPTSAEEALSGDEQRLLGQLTGWKTDFDTIGGKPGSERWGAFWGIVWGHLLGWILTALAVSLGAPFWFDMLNRFMNIRNAGRAPDEPRDKSSKPAPVPAATRS